MLDICKCIYIVLNEIGFIAAVPVQIDMGLFANMA